MLINNFITQGKLEDYQAKQRKGETLNEEQLKAVAKLDDVLSQIELLQDLIKQFTTHSVEVCFFVINYLQQNGMQFIYYRDLSKLNKS